ncbi:MAG TPA: hypothetical protein VFG39_01645 [Balneolaceae bacterium]|nr:hypothetical protein [Balneolaceae bacterium]
MRFKQIPNLIFILALTIVGFACSDSSTDMQPETATVNGRVASNEVASKSASSAHNKTIAVEGAVVTAARITSDGSLHTISGAKAETNAEGEFSLQINMEAVGDAADRVIIMAETESRQWKAYISGELESGSTIELSPLNVESSGEASVYQQLVASGKTDMVTKADVEAFVGTQAAAELKGDTEAAAGFAAALAAEAHARSQFFADHAIEITGQQRNEIENAKAEALAELNARLYASASESAHAEAFDAFLHAMANVYVDAGVDAAAYAKAKEMSTQILIKNALQLSSNAKAEVRTSARTLVAIAIDHAVQASLKAANAAETSIQAAVQAGTQLQSGIKAKITASKSELDAMFEAYNAAIVDILQQEFAANAQVMAGINSEINSTGGIKAALEATIQASLSTDVIVAAYSTFYTKVKAIVDDQFRTATETEAQLVTDVMILINIAN